MEKIEFKGTKGKWICDGKCVYSFHQIGWIKGKPKMANRFYLSIYPDYSNGVTEDEVFANAKLIASAPDMLNALIKIKEIGKFKSDGEIGNIIENVIQKALK